ncbi:MAG: sulfurtransferase [Candidatus Accumulibacter sp.]|uniref:rhodanese-like domain-containing protein n=1 Tax=Accumulibacter sp. TaxID=2053492 RepID=UPI001A038AD8|nr:rhodanese-like domain-containing protein [Accumulibacter sp.]MBE2259534.1 sulfurtransferase [Paracoccaceae bacterium]MCB1940601.1 sulfurtransferase [Accumulibacter sp.]MCP5248307.1 sulfurtransferase [Accumulibacter sp.]
MQQITAVRLAAWLTDSAGTAADEAEAPRRPLLLDVREPWEYELCRLPDSLLLPMQTLAARVDELDRQADIVVICHHGVRSRQVASFLDRQGFNSIYNLAGGVDAWAREVDPAMRRY